MKTPKIIPLIFLFLFSIQLYAQKKLSPVIIDTDCAADDLRCISTLLSISELDVLAILTNDGALSPNQGLQKVQELLTFLNKTNIPTFAGRELTLPAPSWRNLSLQINWNCNTEKPNITKASTSLAEIINQAKTPVDIICLGTLTNISDYMQSKEFNPSKINRIIWYNSLKPLRGANYERDTLAANQLLKSNLRIDVLSNLRKDNAMIDTLLMKEISLIKNNNAKVITCSHQQEPVLGMIKQKHLGFWDDLIPVYLLYPEIFDMQPILHTPNIQYNTNFNVEEAKSSFLRILAGKYSMENNISFIKFPIETSFYQEDVANIADLCIAKYGLHEWKANVLTNEIHGHLGVYSIVGAKMGILAREILGAEIDRINVNSYAGTKPPYSCLNDGIQTSTGATLGLGMIKIEKGKKTRPSAIFTYKGKKVEISLKEEFHKKVDNDLNSFILQYGNLSDGYWKMVRKQALVYWLEWDRHKIFDIANKN